MPYINVKTNAAVPKDKAQAIKSALGDAITAIPGKSEQWLMVGIEPDQILYFQGTDAPAAIVEITIYGSANASAYNAMTEKVTAILHDELQIAQNRIYVKYAETAHWGWNGSNF